MIDLQSQINTQRSQTHDLRKEKFVTQGAFRAALLCKADQGAVKSQRGKLDLVCKLLVSAGILEQSASSGLCVREQKEESKPDVIQQVSDGNGDSTAYLEECLARVEEDIARIESASRAAMEEAQRAVSMASKSCVRANEKCQQVENECRDRLDESLEGSGERIETNSTRIFHLAAEVEGLTKLVKERGAAARPLEVSREETGEVFSVEIADLPHHQPTATIASPPQPAVERILTEPCRKGLVVTRREEDAPEDTQGKVRRSREDHDPRPGVLDEPCSENHDHPEPSVRAASFATNRTQATSPPAWRRRHSAYAGRQVAVSRRKEDSAPARLVVGPMRPQEDRSVDEQAKPSLRARRSPWPLLANEAAATACRLQDVRAFEQVINTDAEAGGEGKRNSVGGDTLNMDELVLHGSDQPEVSTPIIRADQGDEELPNLSPFDRRTPPIGDQTDDLLAGRCRQDDIAPESNEIEDPFENLQAGQDTVNRPDHRQPAPSPLSLTRMTATEAAKALQGVTSPSLARRFNPTEEQNISSSTTAATGMGTGFPGARLACLADTPDLWCPRDTWDDVGAAESSSSEGSSTVVAEGCRQQPRDT